MTRKDFQPEGMLGTRTEAEKSSARQREETEVAIRKRGKTISECRLIEMC